MIKFLEVTAEILLIIVGILVMVTTFLMFAVLAALMEM